MSDQTEYPDTISGTVLTKAKAWVALIVTAVVGIATGLMALIPDPTVRLVCQIIVLVAGVIGTTVGVYQVPNKAVPAQGNGGPA